MSTPPPEGKKPLSTGAIVAIVIVALIIIGAGICFALLSS